MNLPILSKLKDGEKFDFDTLIDNFEQTEQFWEWWWENAPPDKITRPETILDTDPILTATAPKATVDLESFRDYFNKYLHDALKTGRLTPAADLDREDFRLQLIRIIGSNSRVLPDEKRIIFAGGGYGSGKTTILRYLANCGRLGLSPGHMIGVDYYKLLVPEFSLIKRVADGRASLTVQKECKLLADRTFDALVASGRSFIWDSSMSDVTATKSKIEAAKASGYDLAMVAVLTPVELATRQAISRARDSRRFPHPDWLPHSHREFRKAFYDYTQMFPAVQVFAKLNEVDDPFEVAVKTGGNTLDVLDQNALNQALSVAD